jgi:hypothetical protein
MVKVSKLFKDYNVLKGSKGKSNTQISMQDKLPSKVRVTRKSMKITICDKSQFKLNLWTYDRLQTLKK